ncbi:MAG: hypothetical protein QN193_10300 [Armatimonadota bacterium]|nr:hypothetical protein [Armatimonadota bacterium]
MPFTVKDFQDLLRLLQERPEWRDQLRRVLLTDEILQLPRAMRELTEEVRRLAEAQTRTEERLGRLEEAVTRLDQAVARLAEAQARTEQQLEALSAAQVQTERQVAALTETVRALVRDVGDLKGESLERTYRDRAPAYFGRILQRIRVLDAQRLGLLLDEAVEAGRITPDERIDALEADVVVEGRRDGEEVYLVAEVSWQIGAEDVERAIRRASVVERALQRRTLAAVAGKGLGRDRRTQRAVSAVWQVLDGTVSPPADRRGI